MVVVVVGGGGVILPARLVKDESTISVDSPSTKLKLKQPFAKL